MNLHGIAAAAVSAVNPTFQVTIRQSTGSTTNPDGSRTPTYQNLLAPAQIQALQYGDLRQLDGLNITGLRRKLYLYGNWTSTVRVGQKGGDLVVFPDGSTWLIVFVFETWGEGVSGQTGWCSVCCTLQNGGCVPTLSLTQFQALTALRSFLLGTCPAGISVIRAEDNRVPEPVGTDFIVMTPLMQLRLETNEASFADNIVVGSIAGAVLTVSAVTSGALTTGATLTDGSSIILPGTVLGAQLTGSVGGTGTYAVAPSQTLGSEVLYAGVRADYEAVELTVQLDVHGPASGDNARVIEALFRSEVATDQFSTSGFDVTPLYCSDPKQIPWVNAEQQFEYRWTLDACMMIGPVVGTPQQFADKLSIKTIEASAVYTG